MKEQCLAGHTLATGSYRSGGQPRLFFSDADTGQAFAIDDATLYKNLLFLGAAGTGKTNVINQIAYQVRHWPDSDESVLLFFDTKGDYYDDFYLAGDSVVGNGADFRKMSRAWNLFDEVLADGSDPLDYESNAREIASTLFQGRGSETQPFFANAARDIFANTIIFLIRESQRRPEEYSGKLNNKTLVSTIMGCTIEQFRGFFNSYPDMRGLITYFGNVESDQALGVFAELRQMVYDCFQGIFAQAPSSPSESFSIRKAIRNKHGHAIFIEYDLSIGEAMGPMYQLLIDLALKEALAPKPTGRVCIFLDELKLAGCPKHLGSALNFGRSKKVAVFAGIQSVNQIYDNYGKDAGQVILGGFGSVVAMRTSDYESRDYVTNLFGKNIVAYRYETPSGTPVDWQHVGNVVESWDQQALKIGQGIVGLASQAEPFLCQFEYNIFPKMRQ